MQIKLALPLRDEQEMGVIPCSQHPMPNGSLFTGPLRGLQAGNMLSTKPYKQDRKEHDVPLLCVPMVASGGSITEQTLT